MGPRLYINRHRKLMADCNHIEADPSHGLSRISEDTFLALWPIKRAYNVNNTSLIQNLLSNPLSENFAKCLCMVV